MQVQILGRELPQLVGSDCMMGLGYYQDAPFPEMTGLGTFEEWASTTEGKIISGVVVALQFLRPAGAVAAGIHGYRRYEDSLMAAAGWAALGFIFPVVTNVVAMAQGFGKPRQLGCCPV